LWYLTLAIVGLFSEQQAVAAVARPRRTVRAAASPSPGLQGAAASPAQLVLR